MTVEYNFDIGDKVRIIELGTCGIVISLYTARLGNEINVRFCCNGKYDTQYFYEWELEK